MITYKKAGSEHIGDVVKIRVEMLSLMHNRPEADFSGEFARLSEDFFKNGEPLYKALGFDHSKETMGLNLTRS